MGLASVELSFEAVAVLVALEANAITEIVTPFALVNAASAVFHGSDAVTGGVIDLAQVL